MELLSNISSNINLLKDQFEELYFIYLDKSDRDKTAEEKEQLRNMKINSKIQEIFLPYMIYCRLHFENNI